MTGPIIALIVLAAVVSCLVMLFSGRQPTRGRWEMRGDAGGYSRPPAARAVRQNASPHPPSSREGHWDNGHTDGHSQVQLSGLEDAIEEMDLPDDTPGVVSPKVEWLGGDTVRDAVLAREILDRRRRGPHKLR